MAKKNGRVRWPEFWAYHRANPQVYQIICAKAELAIAQGKTKQSAREYVEDIRWNMPKPVRNAMSPFYARYWLQNHPAYPDFFETADSVADDGWEGPPPNQGSFGF